MKIIIIAHGILAQAYKESIREFIADENKINDINTYSVAANRTIETIINEIVIDLTCKGIQNEKVLLCTDLSIGSTTNIAYHVCKCLPNSSLVSGINLRFLLEVLTCNGNVENNLDEYISHAKNDLYNWKLK